MRDVGWAQIGPVPSKSRDGEYGEPRVLSLEENNDFRWIKLRTKGGFLFQASDKGFDPDADRFIKRKLIDEVAHKTEREDKHWSGKDARWLRLVTRYGIKFVMDDRGSHPTDASKKELPHGNGLLIKGRRSPAAAMKEKKGNPRGFYFEFNENDCLNHLTIGTPLGAAMEFNDRYEYVCMSSGLGKSYATKWRGLEENEFLLQPTRHPDRDPEHKSHHLVLDGENEYVRLKTRGNKGPKPDHVVNPSGVGVSEEHQGVEMHDGSNGDGPWVELVDCQGRGLWFSRNVGLGIWRGKSGSSLYHWLDDADKVIGIYVDDAAGKVQIYSRGNVEIMGAGSVTINGFDHLNLKGGKSLTLHGGNSIMRLEDDRIAYNNALVQDVGVLSVTDLSRPNLPSMTEPTDRAKLDNGPFEGCPRDEVEHPIK